MSISIRILGLCAVTALWAISGCAGLQKSSVSNPRNDAPQKAAPSVDPGYVRVFTNAQATMWVPSRANPIWDGHTSVVHVDETTPPGAFVKDYKIEVEIIIVDTPQQLQQMERWGSSDWHFQNHPELSVIDVQYGKQMRKDIWNADRTRRLLINGMITRSATFARDVETAKRMVDSIRLLPDRPVWNGKGDGVSH